MRGHQLEGGAIYYSAKFFPENCMEMKEIRPRVGVGTSHPTPGSANENEFGNSSCIV